MSTDPYKIVIRPVVTEKSHRLMRDTKGKKSDVTLNKYTFEVATDASKGQIKTAVEELFKVKVSGVNTLKMRGKLRRVRKTAGLTRSWKKAVVTLEEGSSIDLY